MDKLAPTEFECKSFPAATASSSSPKVAPATQSSLGSERGVWFREEDDDEDAISRKESSCFSDVSDAANDSPLSIPVCGSAVEASTSGDTTGRNCSDIGEWSPHFSIGSTASLASQNAYYAYSAELGPIADTAGMSLMHGLLMEKQESKAEKQCDGAVSSSFGVTCMKGIKSGGWNQDDYFVLDSDDKTYIGVFDGHGSCGQDSSALSRHSVISVILKSTDDRPVAEILAESFALADSSILGMRRQNTSGTTATLICIDHKKHELTCAHVGDSRAAVIPIGDAGQLVDLTRDHKPEDEEETKRIEAAGGEVRTSVGDALFRIFKAGGQAPGLAMSRSLGDKHGKAVGLSAEPTISSMTLQHTRIVACTDGVWEFLSTEEVSAIISKEASAEAAARTLANTAWDRWIAEEGGVVVDDITIVVYDVPERSCAPFSQTVYYK